MLEDDDEFGATCSNRTVFLHSVKLFFLCRLRHFFTIEDVPHSVLVVLSSILARCDRMSICHLLFTSGFHRYIPCTSFCSRSFSFFHSLFLNDPLSVCIHSFILALPVEVLSSIALIRSRHSLVCGCVALPYDASAVQPGQPPVWP